MNELIKVIETENGSVVNAKDLFLFLEYDISQWSRWCKVNIINNAFALEGKDYVELDSKSRTKEYALSIEFSKKISMMAKNIKGEEARDYFLECESVAKSKITPSLPKLPTTYLEALKELVAKEERIILLEDKNEKLQYRSDFVDVCFDADGVFTFGDVAKILKLGYGSITLYEKMRERGLIMKGTTIPYQKYVSNGYFKVVEELKQNGNFKKLIAVTFATQKGMGYIKKLLDNNPQQNILPSKTINQ
jgi:phage anti-repressor protein